MARFADLPGSPIAPSLGRRHARQVLGEWGLSAEVIATAELLASELITNAMQVTAGHHSRPDLDDAAGIGLTLLRLAIYPIEVADASAEPPPRANASAGDEQGRGLALINALSKEWSYLLSDSGGKVVYCIIETGNEVM